MSPASNHSPRRLRRVLGPSLVFAVALASLLELSGGLPAATSVPVAVDSGGEPPVVVASGDAAGAAPWEGAGPFPAAFDLRDAGRLTGVRSQDSYSTCWIMAAMGSLESSVLRREGLPLDFSENNLANHMASRLDYEGMAPSELALAYFARWEGPVWERSDRYPRPGESPPYLRAVRHLQQALFLPARQGPLDNAAAKWAVTTYGGLDAAVDFRVQEKHASWNESSHAYYNATRDEPNHHVLVVGWDDGYPASRFLAGSRPPGDGAFLIRNSWGADFGDEGYAWVSYYDATIGDALVAFSGVEAAGNYDAVYQYDALGRSAWLGAGAGETAWFANRFTAAGTGTVAAVSFYAPTPGTAFEVRVAGRLGEVAAAQATAAGVITVPGYHTVRLERPAAVSAGRTFVVAVRVATPGWDKPVPVEAPSSLIAPRARAGQSFVSVDGSAWADLTALTALPGLSRANVCLKAFVDAAGVADARAPRVVVRGGVVRRGAQARILWRLEDPSFSSASAIIELSVRNAAGMVVATRRVPAVSVGERGVWTPRADWPRGRYRVTGRAYDVAGHRQAVPTRATVVVRGAAQGAAPGPQTLTPRHPLEWDRGPAAVRRAGRSACPASRPGRRGRAVTPSPEEVFVFLDYLRNDDAFEAAAPRLRRGAAVYAPSFYAPYVLAAALAEEGGGRVVVASDGDAATRLAADLSIYLDVTGTGAARSRRAVRSGRGAGAARGRRAPAGARRASPPAVSSLPRPSLCSSGSCRSSSSHGPSSSRRPRRSTSPPPWCASPSSATSASSRSVAAASSPCAVV